MLGGPPERINHQHGLYLAADPKRGSGQFQCKNRGCKYTRGTPRSLPPEIKRRALQPCLEGVGFRAIGRLLGVSNVAVLKRVRAFGEEVERRRKPGPAPKIATIDEVWRFTHGKKTKPGSGCRCVMSADGSRAFVWVGEGPRI